MSQQLKVNVHYTKKYSITVGMDLWDRFKQFCSERYSSHKLFVVVDAHVHALHREAILNHCTEYFDHCSILEVPPGEQSKAVSEWNILVDRILKEGIERTTPLLAIGGGVVGDLGGFTAASVLRGIPLIHMPTSLLAMVDSSIGGKTGVNHFTGKNLIGAFYQPDAVFADVHFLSTLKRGEWISGMAEVLKYGAIRDPEIFDRVEALVDEGFQPSDQWGTLIRDSARIKADIVQEDTLEAGKRAFLNFGHTFAHALEKKAGYGTISHGEAVFVGMLAATYASKKMGAPVNEARFAPFIPLYSIDLDSSVIDIQNLIELMYRDKKVKDAKLQLILLDNWGNPVIKECDDESLLEASWKFALEMIR